MTPTLARCSEMSSSKLASFDFLQINEVPVQRMKNELTTEFGFLNHREEWIGIPYCPDHLRSKQ